MDAGLDCKSQWIDAALGPITGEAFEWKEIKLRLYDKAAVVNASTWQKAKVGVQDWSGDFLITDVWIWQGDKWQVVSRHGTGPFNQ